MKTFFILGIIAGILVGSVGAHYLHNTEVIEFPLLANIFSAKETHSIPDECGVLLGNVLHNIPNEELCENKCKNSCRTQEKTFSTVEFVDFKGNGCNTCKCTCR